MSGMFARPLFALQLVLVATYSLLCVVTWRVVNRTRMARQEAVSKLAEKVTSAKVNFSPRSASIHRGALQT